MLYQITKNNEPLEGYVFGYDWQAQSSIALLAAQEHAKYPDKYPDLYFYDLDFNVQEIEEPIDVLTNWGVPYAAARYFIDWEMPEDFDVRVFDPHVMFGDRLVLFSEEEFEEEMHFFDCSTEDQFINRNFAAGIWRDDSFDGVLVWLVG